MPNATTEQTSVRCNGHECDNHCGHNCAIGTTHYCDGTCNPPDASEIELLLVEVLRNDGYPLDDELAEVLEQATFTTYSDAGMLTGDAGFVVKLPTGREFQVTVVLSKRGR